MAETDIHVNDNERLVVKRKGGGSIVSHPPVFSADAKLLYIVWGKSIRAYSTQTGEFLQEYEGLNERAAGIQLIRDTETLATCSEKGEVIYWSRKSAVIQEKKDIGLCPGSTVTGFHFLGKERDFFVITFDENRNTNQSMLRFTPSGKDFKKLEMKLNKSQRCYAFGGLVGQEYVGAINKNVLCAMDVNKGKIKRHLVGGNRELVCVSAHPSEQLLATGDQTGCILIWREFLYSKHPPRSIYHWHTLPVSDISFSQAGSSMYSGGKECVMVKWTLDFQEKKFLPRMGASLRYLVVSPDNLLVAVSLDDNSIQLVSPQGKIKKVIQNFTWNAHISCEGSSTTVLQKVRFDPRTKSLVLNGQPGHLQFFSVKSNKLLYNLDVVGQNYLTQERNATVYNTDVTHVTFSCNGIWMATVEQRKDPEASLEARLKFWKFTEKTQNFCLNTSIEYPHGGEIFALEMRPGTEDVHNMIAVTSGADQKFKMWSLIGWDSSYGKNPDSRECWQCDCDGTYKGLPVGDIGFSSDGSILGAVFSHSLTLWVPETNVMKSSLCHPYYQQEIRKVQFGSGHCSHLVVCAMPGYLTVWNLLSLTMSWTVSIELNLLVADSLSSFMAGFTCNRDLVVFKPSDPQPVFIRQNVCPDHILQAIFVPFSSQRPDLMSWQQKSQLYFMNKYQEMLVLENPDDNFKEGAGGGLQGDPEEGRLLSLTPFGRMLAGVSSTSEVVPVTTSNFPNVGVPGNSEIKEFLRMPPHTMPPLRLICRSLMASLIRRSGKKKKDEDVDSETEEAKADEDDDSGMESEGGKDTPGEEGMEVSDKSALQEPESKIYRPRIESTPELEKYLSKVLQERTDWVSSLL